MKEIENKTKTKKYNHISFYEILSPVIIRIIEMLRVEVMIGILEALKDVSGGPKLLSTEMISWLNNYSSFSVNEDKNRNTLRSILTFALVNPFIKRL